MPRSDEEQGVRQQQTGWGSETNTTVRKNADGSTSAQISGPTNQVQAQAPGVAQQAGVSDQGASLGTSVDEVKQQVREYLKTR